LAQSITPELKFQHVGFGGDNRFVPKLEQINENGTRLYATPDGRRYPSVTTILSEHGKEALDAWRNRIGHEEAAKIGARAANRGTRVHTYTEKYLKNEPIDFGLNLFTQELFNTFRPVLGPINNIHCLETRMFSHHLRLAGTVDCIAEYDGKLSVIDFKTASKPKKHEWIHNYFMQCSAYAIMYEELTGIPVPQLVVLVAVEDSHPQVFIERRNRWTRGLLDYRDIYEKNNNSGI
jgi:genome maintenance exonuclease 1